MTILQAHHHAIQLLTRHRYSRAEAHTVARILLDDVTGASHAHLTRAGELLSPAQNTGLEAALSELAAGRPLAYVLGKREFFGLEFRCDERALIPRPETELLVEFALEQLKQRASNSSPRTLRVADLGTGTGCVAISIATHFVGTSVFATDISPQTLALAQENAVLHRVDSRIHFVQGTNGDWATSLLNRDRESRGALDVVVSNPPYIAPRDIEELSPQIKNFEPRRALDGGEDGLDCYRQIATQCGALLRPDGVLACELGIGQFDEVRNIFEESGWEAGDAIFDFQNIPRVLTAQFKR